MSDKSQGSCLRLKSADVSYWGILVLSYIYIVTMNNDKEMRYTSHTPLRSKQVDIQDRQDRYDKGAHQDIQSLELPEICRCTTGVEHISRS